MVTHARKDLTKLHLGWIPYWNLRPLKIELQRMFRELISFENGHPNQVNRLLQDREVQMAPCSSVMLIKEPELEVAVPVGVAATGSVQSVYLGFSPGQEKLIEVFQEASAELREAVRVAKISSKGECRSWASTVFDLLPPMERPIQDKLPQLVLSQASATGACMARLYQRLVISRSNHVFRDNDAIELCIGNDALIRRPQFTKVIDLGAWWFELTGLPFVYAVWQAKPQSFDAAWKMRIIEAASLAQAKMRVEPTDFFPDVKPRDSNGHDIDLAAYWERIRYKLSQEDLNGLWLFLSMARLLEQASRRSGIDLKLLRWQQRAGLPSTPMA